MKHSIYLSIGSNVGNRVEFLAAAVRSLPDLPLTVVDSVSGIYITEPVGTVSQNDFLNAAVSVRTGLDLTDFHTAVKHLEKQIGRTESERWGPREIDIDILLCDAVVITTGALRVPHREMQHRAFVLRPLAEIAPNARHPVLNRSIDELLRDSQDRHNVTYSEEFTSQFFTMINDSITHPTV